MAARNNSPGDAEFYRRLGQRIETARKRKRLTAVELANKAGIRPNTLCQYESGERRCATTTLLKLADAMGYGLRFSSRGVEFTS